jgi:transcription initiation factor TFIIB
MSGDTTQITQEDIVKCPECASRHLDKDDSRGERVCIDCGLVIEDDMIDESAEWRVFTMEDHESKARTGAPMTQMIHDKGLSISYGLQGTHRLVYNQVCV